MFERDKPYNDLPPLPPAGDIESTAVLKKAITASRAMAELKGMAAIELAPWLEQWHNMVDPTYGNRMGAHYKGFVSEEARKLGFTLDDLRAWKPEPTTRRGKKKTST